MINRFVLKIEGASGTGINTVGKTLSKAFKNSGYYSLAYREYPSLIKGGLASFQIDVSDKQIGSSTNTANLLLALDRVSFAHISRSAIHGQYLIYDSSLIRVDKPDISVMKDRGINIYDLPLSQTAKDIGGSPIMKNVVAQGVIWKLLGLDLKVLTDIVIKIFNKSDKMLAGNRKSVIAGFALVETNAALLLGSNLKPNGQLRTYMSITGNEALALGAVASGVRAFFAYPMTPSTSILTTMAKMAKSTGILVKQAEDEITAVSLTIGASFVGTRALTTTAGGGLDLMSETVSLSGITETPLVIIVAQRPGPGTGLPTWTSQGDLKIAINAGHGEYPRVVLAPGDPEECFYLSSEAQNLAERFQIPVILLTDKNLAENIYTTKPFDQSRITINRGKLDTKIDNSHQNRYELTKDGVSPRWSPGLDMDSYLANSDEHDAYGHSIEDKNESQAMMDKRMRKLNTIIDALPEPKVYGHDGSEVSFICWGSTKWVLLDAMDILSKMNIFVNILHFSYVYPLKTKVLARFIEKSKRLVLIENNQTGQLGELIHANIPVTFTENMLKYNGRPFYVDEVVQKVKNIINN